jgi:hypothetical protein
LSAVERLKRVRLKPLAQLLLLAALAVVAYVALGTSIVREKWHQDALSAQIDLGEGVLLSVADARQDLEELRTRLTEAKQELAAAETAFPTKLDSKDILEMILGDVGESKVRLLRIDIREPITEVDEGSAYNVLGLDLDVEGNFGQLVAFLAALENSATSTTRIGSFTLEDKGGQNTLNLELLTYAQSPAAEPTPADGEGSAGEGTDATTTGEEAPSQ